MFQLLMSVHFSDPTWIFFVVLLIILLAPLLFERLHIPQIVGMILAGVLIGPHGLDTLARDSSFELFGQVGCSSQVFQWIPAPSNATRYKYCPSV